MNIKYRLRFWPRPLSMTDFSASLFARAIACVGGHTDNDPLGSFLELEVRSFTMTSQMRTSSEPSQEQSIILQVKRPSSH